MVTRSVVHIILMLCLTIIALREAASQLNPGCQEKCGDIDIPYPFGIGSGCYLNSDFAVNCTNTSSPPKPFISSIDLEILAVSLSEATVHVNYPVFSSNCPNKKQASNLDMITLFGTPFSFSDTRNRFTALGCNNLALITSRDGSTLGGCISTCNTTRSESGCYGVNCCQTSIPPSLKYLNTSLRSIDHDSYQLDCKHAFLVDQEWFAYNTTFANALENSMESVPAVLDWAVRGTCESLVKNDSTGTNSSTPTKCSTDAYCQNHQSSTHLCLCERGFRGNPYLPEGCQDIDECADPKTIRCIDKATCINLRGDYACSVVTENSRGPKLILSGVAAGVGILLLIIGIWWVHKALKKRKKKMLKKKFFKRNGGLILEKQLSSGDEGNVEKTKLFTSKELEKATDNYNNNRFLGQGGQGTVYKGMLTDGRIVAVKKSKIVDEDKLQEFINEVVILSQINHRNVVKLFGCCLETEVPMLVYEFIPKGSLFQHIHEKKEEEFPLSWKVRLRVATEVSSALSYLHSSASIPIYHRDIKSSNILLDDKYQAKVSDFGTSRSMAVDQTHFTTKVQGTFGYLDPEYFQSNQFTEKSDVYSFGVVLVELFTGEKAISSLKNQEGRSLATNFIYSMKENRLYDILDAQVVKEAGKEEIMAVANLALRCLNLNGRKRPTMKEVSMELEGIKRSQGETITEENYEEFDYNTVTEIITAPWDDVSISTSTGSCLNNSVSSSLDVQPLLLNRS